MSPLFRRRAGARRHHESEAAARIAELTASRRAVADAYEVERRRIERDLHDGTQQYLVAAMMTLGEARLHPAVEADPGLAGSLAAAQNALQGGLDALRTTVRGIHPQVLTELGLAAALEEVAQGHRGVRVMCPHPLPALPEGVLAAAYFFATEALTNATKHAPGASVTVLLSADEHLRVSVLDTGPGGAVLLDGHGLAGMRERLAAFGGDLTLSSPIGGPTQVAATIPLLLRRGDASVPLGSRAAVAPAIPASADDVPDPGSTFPLPPTPDEDYR